MRHSHPIRPGGGGGGSAGRQPGPAAPAGRPAKNPTLCSGGRSGASEVGLHLHQDLMGRAHHGTFRKVSRASQDRWRVVCLALPGLRSPGGGKDGSREL